MTHTINPLYVGAVIKGIKSEPERIIRARVSDAVLDRDGEIIRVSAWKDKGLDAFLENSGALLISHKYEKLPIGKILKFWKAADGLYMEAQIIKGTEAAEEAWAVIQQVGKIGFSVGFIPKDWDDLKVSELATRERESCLQAGRKDTDKIRVYTHVELLEISLVSVPSLATATLISYKAGKIRSPEICQACRDCEITIEPDDPEIAIDPDDPEITIEPDPQSRIRAELRGMETEKRSLKQAIKPKDPARLTDKDKISAAVKTAVAQIDIRPLIDESVKSAINQLRARLGASTPTEKHGPTPTPTETPGREFKGIGPEFSRAARIEVLKMAGVVCSEDEIDGYFEDAPPKWFEESGKNIASLELLRFIKKRKKEEKK